MAKGKNIKSVKKRGPSQLSSILSIALVLFLIGLIGLLMVNAQAVSDYFKENLQVNIILSDTITETELSSLQQNMERNAAVKSLGYVSKNMAKTMFEESFGEGIEEVLGFNPLYASLDVNLNAAYANNDSLTKLQTNIEKYSGVKEVHYQKTLLELVDQNFRTAAFILLAVSVLFLIVAITIIDNTIKLTLYSKRFLIKSMQLVGATRSFITKPFLKQSLSNGILAAVLAVTALVGVLVYIQQNFPDFLVLKDAIRFGIVILIIFGVGIFISWWSTRRSILRYIKMKLDDLY